MTNQFVPRVRGLTTPRVLRPIRDGWVINQEERAAYATGQFQPVPMIVGGNLDEGSMFVNAWPIETAADFENLVGQNFGGAAREALIVYAAAGDADLLCQCGNPFGDTQFTYGAWGIARANSTRQPTFRYLFTRRPGDRAQAPLHGEEVCYVFGNLATRLGESGVNRKDEAISESLTDAWVRFAATGNPNGGSLPNWPAYDAGKDNYLDFGDTIHVRTGIRTAQMAFLDRFFDTR
ncbi:MAG: carboxylesterase family protein [Candidatus Binataceae bacterium]